MTYDYIICGGGMAGLSLAFYMNKSATLRQKQILIIDPAEKNSNDRTWRFWEEGEGLFDDILYGTWQKLQLRGHDYDFEFDITPYIYKKIRGIDFYNFLMPQLKANPNVDWLRERIVEIQDQTEGVSISTDTGKTVQGKYAFDSTFALPLDLPENHNLLQHFKGWAIKTPTPCFNPAVPTWMDFRVPHQQDCRFVYTLPYSETFALVEYTLFNEKLLTDAEYDAVLKNYIENTLGIEQYEITEVEKGVIPMSDVPINEQPSPHILRIGTSGGYTHAATGYTFARTQKFLREIVSNLEKTGNPSRKKHFGSWRFDAYASAFLDVLQKNKVPASEVFGSLFHKNPPARILKFLHNETTLWEEIRLMSSTNIKAFGISFFRYFF